MTVAKNSALLALMLAPMAVASPSFAETASRSVVIHVVFWNHIFESDCLARFPAPYVLKEKAHWTGGCVDGKISGPGTLTGIYSSGDSVTLTGAFEAGQLEGQGSVVWSNGASWEGTFLHGALEGEGNVVDEKAVHYRGSLHDGLPDGAGHEDLPDGTAYDGQFKNGVHDGHGILSFSGTTLEGEFQKGQPVGMVTVHQKGKVDVTGQIELPRPGPALDHKLPLYPTPLLRIGAQFNAELFTTVMPDGSFANNVVYMPNGDKVGYRGLKKDTLAAVAAWHDVPARVNGSPIAMPVRINLQFRMRQN